MKLCGCGCGQEVEPNKHFRRGHNSRVWSEESNRKRSVTLKGKPHKGGGRCPNPAKEAERCQKISMSLKGVPNPKIRLALKGRPNPKVSLALKGRLRPSEIVAKILTSLKLKPNKIELKLEACLSEDFPGEWKYVGNGQLIIGGKCPDFANVNGQKKLVELYGDYWHRGENPQRQIDHYARFGYATLVIWEHELKNIEVVKQKLLEFGRRDWEEAQRKEET